MSVLRPHSRCECGALATRMDGSGPHCEACREWVQYISDLVEDVILSQRYTWDEIDERKRIKAEQKAKYYRQNIVRLKKYHQQYDAKRNAWLREGK